MGMLGWILVGLGVAYGALFIYKTRTGSPYLPSEERVLSQMRRYVQGKVVCDFGAGDGRVLEFLVRQGGVKEAWGWEIEPLVWLKGWWRLRQLPPSQRRRIHYYWGDMWQPNLSQFEVLVVYQLETKTEKLAKKCRKEMKPGSLVVANTYPVSGLKLKEKNGQLHVYQL